MNQRQKVPRNGHTVKEAASLTGLSTATIIRWTSEPRENYLARANEKRAKVAELRAQGLTMRAIAKEFGCSVGTVHRYVKEVQAKALNLPAHHLSRVLFQPCSALLPTHASRQNEFPVVVSHDSQVRVFQRKLQRIRVNHTRKLFDFEHRRGSVL